jgi:Tfp pilus assembly protein PilX
MCSHIPFTGRQRLKAHHDQDTSREVILVSQYDRGSVLLNIMIGFIVVTTVLSGIMTLVPSLWLYTKGYGEYALALQTAESGLMHAQSWLRSHPLDSFNASYPYAKTPQDITNGGSYTVTFDPITRNLIATGRYNKSERKLSVVVTSTTGETMVVSSVLYSQQGLDVVGNAEIKGTVTINKGYNATGVGEDQVLLAPEDTYYRLPSFPDPPAVPNKGNLTIPKDTTQTISTSGAYDTLTVNGTLQIGSATDAITVELRVDTLNLGGQIVILGSSTLVLYIEEKVTFGTDSAINDNGDPAAVFIYHAGTSGITIDDMRFFGSLVIKTADLTIDGKKGQYFRGNIITGSTDVNIKSARMDLNGLLYAPRATLGTVAGQHMITGSVVVKSVKLAGQSTLIYDADLVSIGIPIPTPISSSTIAFSNWSVL